jgi:RNA polymerase sigma factor (sigma-70 family)
MQRDPLDQRLSQISTAWSVLRQAHAGAADAAAAQQLLVQRYGPAIHRYLLAAVRDAHAADELFQQFFLDLLRGRFRHADPQRGRFRQYVKTALFHLVGLYRRKQQRQPPQRPDDPSLADPAAPPEDLDRQLDAGWRDDLLARTWQALAQAHPTSHAVLRFRAEHDRMPSAAMAGPLSHALGKPLTADGIRQALRRARERFADLLIEEVAQSLESPTVAELEQELRELNLLSYCQPALQRRGRPGT